MKHIRILVFILASAGILTNCGNPPPTPVPAATVTRAATSTPVATRTPTATPTSTPTSPDQIFANASDVSINGTLALNQTNAPLNAGSDIATNSSGNATVNFINPDGSCTLYSDSRITTRPDNLTVFNQAMGTSYCNFAGNQPKQLMAGGVVLINSHDPALRIVVTPGNQVNVAVFEGEAVVTLAQNKQSLLKNQEAQVNLRTSALVRQPIVFTASEIAGFIKLNVLPRVPPGLASKGKIGLVADVGGVSDKGFNQSAWEGTQKAARDFGLDAKFAESKQAADYEKNIDQFANAKSDVIVTVGSLMGNATAVKAKQYPNLLFGIVDNAYLPTKGDRNCPDTVKDCYADGGLKNVTSLMFQEDQAGFLAGVLAGGMTRTGTVCTVSGIRIPTVTRYVTGFQNGARWSRPNVKVLNGPVSSFTDPARGKEIGQSLIAQGCDVLFGVAGTSGNGALLAAKEKGLMAIGVDVDQYNTTPEVRSALLTSAQKRVDVAVYNYLKSVLDGSVKAGIVTGNVQNGGVGLAPFHDWDTKIPQSVKDLVNKALDGLKSGAIQTGYKP
ncbi:MAG: BMP family lipoprotein [Acidobacteriota bacterium]